MSTENRETDNNNDATQQRGRRDFPLRLFMPSLAALAAVLEAGTLELARFREVEPLRAFERDDEGKLHIGQSQARWQDTPLWQIAARTYEWRFAQPGEKEVLVVVPSTSKPKLNALASDVSQYDFNVTNEKE